jgi:NAD+ kinase
MEFGILHHPRKPESLPLAQEITRWLRGKGHSTWQASNWDTEEVHRRTAVSHLLIVLGGDGSILRAARCAVPYDTPILGVNLGRIGFLSEAEPENWPRVLQHFLDGNHWLEQRLMLKAQIQRQDIRLNDYMALNEFVISGTRARVVHLELTVDDDPITTYTADGLIAATPTGSTAYSMAAGGPLLPPDLRNFLLLPVAPYLSLDRALVLHEEAQATIRVNSDQEAYLMADGQETITLQNLDCVIITKHEHVAQFVRVGHSSYFYRRLLQRLGFERSDS